VPSGICSCCAMSATVWPRDSKRGQSRCDGRGTATAGRRDRIHLSNARADRVGRRPFGGDIRSAVSRVYRALRRSSITRLRATVNSHARTWSMGCSRTSGLRRAAAATPAPRPRRTACHPWSISTHNAAANGRARRARPAAALPARIVSHASCPAHPLLSFDLSSAQRGDTARSFNAVCADLRTQERLAKKVSHQRGHTVLQVEGPNRAANHRLRTTT